jgi:hypothetical protein
LDGTYQLCDEDTLVSNVSIRVFIMGDLAFYVTVVGKEGMDKAHCHWYKLPSSQWQTLGHAPGSKWTLQELKQVAGSLHATKRTENRVKGYPQLDCVELERYIFPVIHVTLGLANWLLNNTVDYVDIVLEKTPQVLKTARLLQIEASHKHEAIKQEIVDWGTLNGHGPTVGGTLCDILVCPPSIVLEKAARFVPFCSTFLQYNLKFRLKIVRACTFLAKSKTRQTTNKKKSIVAQ